MMKETVLALFGLVITLALVAPPKANAQVAFGIGRGRPYGYAVPRAYVFYAPAPYVAYEPGYVYPYAYAPYPEVVLGGGWYGGGYGYGRGYGGTEVDMVAAGDLLDAEVTADTVAVAPLAAGCAFLPT